MEGGNMTAINYQEAREKVCEVRKLADKIDNLLELYLNPKVYANGDCTIQLSNADKTKIKNEYIQMREELETKVGKLPE